MTSPRPRTLRATALAAGLAVAGLVLAGCSATNPMTTEDQYSASDGVRVTLGDVRASNLLVLSAAEGDVGSLQGGLVNESSEDRTVTLAVGDEQTTVELGPKETVLLGAGRAQEEGFAEVTFPAIEVPPGGLLPITVSTPEAGSVDVQVPVLDGTLPEYASAVPTASS
ncbi:hypothetical protein HP550_16610 [Cellulomonas humilata]|uniref:Lipoprotein n=1 Tax=Cellulomonas humilata TaxID=144055 RepID=A0A7Y6DXT9_9CELL|nr:hypothetical protein [Cellulomonas humilata]